MTRDDEYNRQIMADVMRALEREGRVQKKRDALGNIVTRPGRDGKPQVVWEAVTTSMH